MTQPPPIPRPPIPLEYANEYRINLLEERIFQLEQRSCRCRC